MRSKKQLILQVLNILDNESSEQNPMTQTKIAEIISEAFPCDRKTVCRNIKFLQEMGYPIRKTVKGFYMDNKVFSVEEIDFIKDAILASDNKSEGERTEIAQKVANALTKMRRR